MQRKAQALRLPGSGPLFNGGTGDYNYSGVVPRDGSGSTWNTVIVIPTIKCYQNLGGSECVSVRAATVFDAAIGAASQQWSEWSDRQFVGPSTVAQPPGQPVIVIPSSRVRGGYTNDPASGAPIYKVEVKSDASFDVRWNVNVWLDSFVAPISVP